MENEVLKTPYFLLHEDLLAQNIAEFRTAMDEHWPYSVIAYSVKTNSLPWILKWMNKHDVYAEVVSDEEYQLALLSGYETDRIVFNGPIKTNDYLKKAFEGGSVINIDSKHEIDYIKKEKPEIKGLLGIRVNVDSSIFDINDVGYQEDGFRFGFSKENGELKKSIAIIHGIYGNIPIGLHLHVNSITRSLNVYRSIAKYTANVINDLNLVPAFIDIGGGFFCGVPGKTTPQEYIETIKSILEQSVDIEKTKLIIEPGSAAVGSTIDLYTSVLDVKDTIHGRIVTTDGSRVYIDPLWLKKGYSYSTDSSRSLHQRQMVCGYTCMDHDRIMVIEDKPELQVDDHIVYHRVGNYTVTFGGPFIKPYPPVYCKTKKGLELIRKQMSVEEYYRMETI